MKKNILWFLPFFIFIQNLPAQTNVSGIITSDTTWSITGTPYIVTGGILVDGGVTLMIEPGVTIKCNNGMSFQIDGAMIAQGTEIDKITFTSNYAGEYWGYILFTDSSIDATYDIDGNYTGGSILEHCIVEYAGLLNIENNGSIRLNNAHPFINNCTIRNNTASGIYAWSLSDTLKITNNIISNNVETHYSIGGGIVISGRRATISNNTIRDNVAINGGGINIQHGSTAYITNNNINNNTATGSYWLDGGGGIYITSGNYSPSYVTISNNIISNNNAVSVGGGINAYDWRTTVYITNNVINNNNAGYSGGGIQAYQGGPSVISSNSIIANSSGLGSAIHLENADFQITNNTITENQATSETPAYAIFTNYPNSIISYNNIFGNITDSPPIYDLYYGSGHGSTNLNATNNWWGTTSGSIIQSLIYDWVDDGSLGIVDYIPYLDTPDTTAPPIPAQNLTITAIDNDLITLGWDSCLIGDLSGYKIHYDTDSTGYPYSYSIDVGNVTSDTLSTLYIGSTYYIAVTTYDIYGNESWYSNEMTGTTRVMEVESLDIGGDEDSQHLVNHRPAISWHYYDSMNELQTHYQVQVSFQPTFLVISHWNTGEVLSSDSSTIYWGDSL
ncbi:MAG: fibronectin type III domain-containing protein, partial [Candidatus Marinimicrobia bacterium]|nr:fibronectin type III domain-containing protein [Candidatus Neomarinimicrobiota bacterium]